MKDIPGGFVALSSFDNRNGQGDHSQEWKRLREAIEAKKVRAYKDLSSNRVYVNEEDAKRLLGERPQAAAKANGAELAALHRIAASLEFQEAILKDVVDLLQALRQDLSKPQPAEA